MVVVVLVVWSLFRFEDQLRLRVLTVFPPGEISARPLLSLSAELDWTTLSRAELVSQSTEIALTRPLPRQQPMLTTPREQSSKVAYSGLLPI